MDLSFLKDVLHDVSQGLTYPVIALLIIAIGYALYSIGSLLVELFIERRYFKVAIPSFLRAIDEAECSDMPTVIKESGMLERQKAALVTIFDNRDLQEEARWALAKKMMTQETDRYNAIVGRNNIMSKIAPMLGLMGTLIPLGPGIVALGQGDTATLSGSLLVAFDTTVAGLIVAAVVLVIAKIRRRWYDQYMSALEAAVTTLLERIDLMNGKGAGKTEA